MLLASRVFGISSLLAPFSFAAALGAIASGKVGVGGPVVPVWQACLDPLAIAFGAVALTATAFSGASFLVGDARRYRADNAEGPDLVEYFRRRTVVAAVALLAVSLIVLLLIAAESPSVFHGMVAGLGLPFAITAVLAVSARATRNWGRVYRWDRVLAAMGLRAVVVCWCLRPGP